MWLIAVALPIQGVAAATMLHCGSTHEHGRASLANQGHVHHHEAMQAEGGRSHHLTHEHTAAHPVADHSAGHHHDGGKAGCSVCASCCSAAVLPAMSLVVVSQDLTETAPLVASAEIVVFLTDGPERPPRTILA